MHDFEVSRDSVTDSTSRITGKCLSMCSDPEIRLREREGLLHLFEMLPGTEKYKRPTAAPSKMVKEYSRPAAGKQDTHPSELRPPVVLQQTVDYLFTNIARRIDISWTEVYHFIFDRLRAVRQDLVIQNYQGHETINILENAIRFYIYAEFRLFHLPIDKFDPKINDQHTQECLKRLLVLYSQSDGYHKNRNDLEALYLIYNLGRVPAIRHYYDLDKNSRVSPQVLLAYRASIACLHGNYIRVFKLCSQMPMLHRCTVHRHWGQLQRDAFKVMCSAYNSKSLRVPVSYVTRLLRFNSESDTYSVCDHYGIATCSSSIAFTKGSFTEYKILQTRSSEVDKDLEDIDISNLLLGQASLEKEFSENLQLHCFS